MKQMSRDCGSEILVEVHGGLDYDTSGLFVVQGQC